MGADPAQLTPRVISSAAREPMSFLILYGHFRKGEGDFVLKQRKCPHCLSSVAKPIGKIIAHDDGANFLIPGQLFLHPSHVSENLAACAVRCPSGFQFDDYEIAVLIECKKINDAHRRSIKLAPINVAVVVKSKAGLQNPKILNAASFQLTSHPHEPRTPN